MLLHIREKAQGWIAFAIVALLILGLSTVAWDAYFSPDPEVPVASVNGQKITSQEFQREYQQQRAIMKSRLRSMLGENADISQFIPDDKVFKDNVLKRLQEEELAFQATSNAGYRVGDSMLAQQIRSFEAFQNDGQFSSDLYKQWLRQNYYSPGGFEDMLRRDVVVQQYRLGIVASAWVSEQEQNSLLKLQQQKRDIEYIVISATGYLDSIEVSDDDAQQYFDSNKIRFATEEQVSIEYIELAITDLTADVDIEEATLLERYQDNLNEFGVPEERRTRHILIEVSGDASEDILNEAKKLAESLTIKLREGADFAALAKQYSDDFGSANSGGDLGYMTFETMMDPSFAEAAFSLEQGAVSGAVKSPYGFHVIEVTDIKPSSIKSFDSVRAQLEREYRLAQAEDDFFEQSELLANLTFENPDTLEIAAEELGVEIKSTPMFSRNFGPGLATEADVRLAAFSEDVLIDGLNSQMLELAGDRVVVLRVKEHKEVTTRPFEEVKEQILTQLLRERAQAKAQKEGKEFLNSVLESKDFPALAKQNGYKLEKPETPVSRHENTINPELLNKVFRMGYPEDNESLFDGVAMSNGDYAVIALHRIVDGEDGASVTETLTAQRESYYGTNEYLGAMADMRSESEIEEFPENY